MEKEQCKSQIVVSRKHTLCTHRYHGNTQHPCTLKKYYIRKSITTYLKEMYIYTFGFVTLYFIRCVGHLCFQPFGPNNASRTAPPNKTPANAKNVTILFTPLISLNTKIPKMPLINKAHCMSGCATAKEIAALA